MTGITGVSGSEIFGQKDAQTMRELAKADETLLKILPVQKLHRGMTYVRSQFVVSMTIAGKRVAYSTLTRQMWETDYDLDVSYKAEEIEREKDLIALLQGYFLVPAGKDECSFYEGVSGMLRTLRKTKGITGYTILPTLACNARCVYCYEAGMEQTSMTPEVTEQTIRYILKTKYDGKIELNWFGGEPLLGGKTIDRICEGLRDAGVEYSSGMITNGSLLTETIADKMAGLWKIRHVQVSMDGAERDYIARKRYVHYDDEYHTVLRGVNLLAVRNIRVAIRCNVDEDNFGGIESFLSDLSAAIPDKRGVYVYLVPLNAVRCGDHDLAMWRKVMETEALIREAGFSAVQYHGSGIRLRVHHCMADAGNVVIAPDGSLYLCEHCLPKSRFGDIVNGITDEAAQYAFSRTDRTREMCRTCPFLPDCTSFASCPVWDTDCLEKRLMQFEYNVKQWLESGPRKGMENTECTEETHLPVC